MSVSISGDGALTGIDQGFNVVGVVTASGGFSGNLTGTASTATAAATSYGISGSPTLSGITSVSTTNLTVNGNAYPSVGPLSNRNLIINGDMKVSQRGISTTGLTGNYNDYTTLDRYRFENYNDGGTNTSVWSMEQSTDAPSGFSNSLKLTATTANADYGSGSSQTNVNTRLEAQNLQHLKYGTASAENLTLSFWVKSSVTGTYLIWFYQDDDGRHCTKTYTINAANTWEYKTVTISGDTTGVIDNDNGLGLHVRWLLATGSIFTSGTYLDGSWANFTNGDTYAGHAVNVASSTNNTFYLTGAQLEVGTVATPFEHRSYGDELARCQRYYYRIGGSSVYTYYGVAVAYSVDNLRLGIPLKVSMRTAPSSIDVYSQTQFLTERDVNSNNVSSSITLSGNTTTELGFIVIDSDTNFSIGGAAYNVYAYNTANTFVGFSAEI